MATFNYSEGILEYNKRTKTHEQTCRFIDENHEWLNLDTVESVLSIGAGAGVIDKFLLDKCSNIKQYIGVEPDGDLYKMLNNSLMKFSQNKQYNIALHNSGMETFDFKEKKFDLILLTQVIYYVPDKAAYLRSFVDSLTKDGILVITMASPLFGNMEENPLIPQRKYYVSEFKDDMKSAGISKYENKVIDVHVDFRDAPDQLVNLFFLRDTTENERQTWRNWIMEKFDGVFNNQAISVFKIQKQKLAYLES